MEIVKKYKFNTAELEKQIPLLIQKKVTEVCINDENVSKNKKALLHLLNLFYEKAPSVFVNIFIEPELIDKEVINSAQKVFCSFDIPMNGTIKGEKFLFDKKFYSKKTNLLNQEGLVFGFYLTYADKPNDSLKLYLDRLDFAIQQYPNHLDFPQTESLENGQSAKVTAFFSAKDIRYARDVSFACRTFYTAGRAVTWMNSVLKPLKIYPSKFFADFAEWQRCNNCDFKNGFNPENESSKSIEKMQILFLEQKYEEKGISDLLPLVRDVVKINGAMARLCGEGEESIVETSYNPDDLFSPECLELESFFENVCMEHSKVRIFNNDDNPDYIIL